MSKSFVSTWQIKVADPFVGCVGLNNNGNTLLNTTLTFSYADHAMNQNLMISNSKLTGNAGCVLCNGIGEWCQIN